LLPGSGLGLVGGGVLCLVGAAFVVVLAVGAFLFWLYRLGTDEGYEIEGQEIWESEDQATGESDDQTIEESGPMDDLSAH
jgi:hypothetical protein